MATEVYKTIVQVTVYSRRPLTEDERHDIGYLEAEIDYGDMIGSVKTITSEPVPLPEDVLRDELRAIGNDGTFFDDFDEGEDGDDDAGQDDGLETHPGINA